MRQVGGGRDVILSEPSPLVWGPTGRRVITIAEFPPEEPGFQAPHKDPQPGGPAAGRESP